MKDAEFTVKVRCAAFEPTQKQKTEWISALARKGTPGESPYLFIKEMYKAFDLPRKGNPMFKKKHVSHGELAAHMTEFLIKQHELRGRIEKLEKSDETQDAQLKSLVDVRDEMRMNISFHNNQIDQLQAEIDKLKYPMGRIMPYCGPSYRYANKLYPIYICIGNITGFRKKGEYLEITWNESVDETDLKIYTKTFLLKDELIPLDATVDFGNIEFEDVE